MSASERVRVTVRVRESGKYIQPNREGPVLVTRVKVTEAWHEKGGVGSRTHCVK